MARSTHDEIWDVTLDEDPKGETDVLGAYDASNPTEANDVAEGATIDDGGAAFTGAQVLEPAPGIGDDLDAPATDLDDIASLGGSTLMPDLEIGDESALDDLANPGGAGTGTPWDDVTGASSFDPTDGIDGTGTGSGAGLPFEDQTGWARDGAADFPYGSGPPDVGQWDTIESTTDVTPSGAVVTETSWEPANHTEEGELGQSSAHGEEQPGSEETPEGHASGYWGNSAEGSNSEDQDGARSTSLSDHQVSQVDDDHYDDDEESEQSDSESQGTSDEQTDAGMQTDSTPIPDEVSDGSERGDGGDLDGSLGGEVDPAPEEAQPAGDAGGLDTGGGDIDYDEDLAQGGGGGAIDPQLFGAVDPVDDMATSELAEAFAPEDAFEDLGVEFDAVDLDVGLEDVAG